MHASENQTALKPWPQKPEYPAAMPGFLFQATKGKIAKYCVSSGGDDGPERPMIFQSSRYKHDLENALTAAYTEFAKERTV